MDYIWNCMKIRKDYQYLKFLKKKGVIETENGVILKGDKTAHDLLCTAPIIIIQKNPRACLKNI